VSDPTSAGADSSTEIYTDSTGIDLEKFIVNTLHKNVKDRAMMLEIENELRRFVSDAR
jgi:encore-like protein